MAKSIGELHTGGFQVWRQRSEAEANASCCTLLCSTPSRTYEMIDTTIPLELRASVREMFQLFALASAAYVWNAVTITAMWWEGNWGGVGVVPLALAWTYVIFGIGTSWRCSFMTFYRACRDNRGDPGTCFLISCSISALSLCLGAVGLTTDYGTAGALILLSIIASAPTFVVVMLAVATVLWTAAALYSVKVLRHVCARGRGGSEPTGFAIDREWSSREYGAVPAGAEAAAASSGSSGGGAEEFGFQGGGGSGYGDDV